MTCLRVLGNQLGNAFLKIAGVGKVQTLVDADRQHLATLDHRVTLDVAEMLAAGNLTDHRDMRLAGAPEKQQQRQPDADQNARLDADQQDPKHGRGHGCGILTGIPPGTPQCAKVDQTEHSHHDGRGQYRMRQVGEQRREEQHRHSDAHGSQRSCHRRLRARLVVDYRAGESAGYRKATSQRCGDIGATEGDQFLIRLDPLATAGCQRLRHRHRLDEADQTDQQRRRQQLHGQLQIQCRQGQLRQPGRNLTNQSNTGIAQVQQDNQQHRDQQRQHRPATRQVAGQARTKPQPLQQRAAVTTHQT